MTTSDTMTIWRSRLRGAATLVFSLLSLAGCRQELVPDANQNLTMKPSITYLHLLRNTPFFRSLTTAQLQWVIDHSREWEVATGALLSKRDANGTSDTDYWILLDGGWRLEGNGQAAPSGNTDPGKWFNTREAHGHQVLLVATEHGYVMRIAETDMTAMLKAGFAFDSHLNEGRRYYASIFGKPK